MKRHFESFGSKDAFILLLAAAALVAGFVLTPISTVAQSGSGKAVPRLTNGKPDFSGVWDHPRVGDVSLDVPAGACAGESRGCKSISSGALQFTALGKTENERKDKFDYGAHCLPWGYIRSYGTPYPHAYVQSADRLAILWEQDNAYHMVPTDGRKIPPDVEPTWRGTSVGRWEGDTLVIETAGFNGRTWLDTAQHLHSDQLRVTERLRRTDFDHIEYEVTMDDPKYYAKPIKNTRTFVLMKPGQELFEYSCTENNRCEGGNCTPSDVQKGSK